MVLAAVSKKDKTEIVLTNAKVNAQAYTTMISDHLILFIEEKWGGGDNEATFQQDNAPANSSVHTKEWIFDNFVSVMRWPAKSLDLNVIENSCTRLVRKVYQGNRQFDHLGDIS